MTDAERDMLALTVKCLDDMLGGLQYGNGSEAWMQLNNTWCDKSNPLRELLREEDAARLGGQE